MYKLKHKKHASSYHKLEGALDSRKFLLSIFHAASFKSLPICLLVFFFAFIVNAQQTEVDPIISGFRKTLHERSVRIINTLGLTDSAKYNNVIRIVADQYFDLNKIHDKTKESIAAIKSLHLSDEEKSNLIKKEEEQKRSRLSELHKGFISKLRARLDDDQIELIKDGMTYRVMPITYTAYQDMIPGLTPVQKAKIYDWLKEARELAMDEGSSDDKHKVFGKFKGKIGNYLSAEGYDMKKEEKAWQERLKEKKQNESAQMNAE